MPDVTPMQSFPFPTDADDPDIPGDLEALANAIERRVVGVYANAADRDSKIPSPQTGQFAYLIGTNELTVYQGATWVIYPEQEEDVLNPDTGQTETVPVYPKIYSGTGVPQNSLGNNGDIYFRI